MVKGILTHGADYGHISTESMHLPLISAKFAINAAPTILISTEAGGIYYLNPDAVTFSPAFNKNSPICGESAVVVSVAPLKRVFLVSKISDSERIHTITISELDGEDLKAGKYSPKLLKSRSFALRSTLLSTTAMRFGARAVDTLSSTYGSPIVIIWATDEIVRIDFDSGETKRLQLPPLDAYLYVSGYAPYALYGNASVLYLIDLGLMEMKQCTKYITGLLDGVCAFEEGFCWSVPGASAADMGIPYETYIRKSYTDIIKGKPELAWVGEPYAATSTVNTTNVKAVLLKIPYDINADLGSWEYIEPEEFAASLFTASVSETPTTWTDRIDRVYFQPPMPISARGGYGGGDWCGNYVKFEESIVSISATREVRGTPWFTNMRTFPSPSECSAKIIENAGLPGPELRRGYLLAPIIEGDTVFVQNVLYGMRLSVLGSTGNWKGYVSIPDVSSVAQIWR